MRPRAGRERDEAGSGQDAKSVTLDAKAVNATNAASYASATVDARSPHLTVTRIADLGA